MKIKLNNKIYDVIIANTFKLRLYGLINQTNINYAMLFPNCNAIHTFFMKEAIDVIGLNEYNEIIFIKQNIDKNKIIKISHNIEKTSILELPKNTSNNLKLGDKITFFSNI